MVAPDRGLRSPPEWRHRRLRQTLAAIVITPECVPMKAEGFGVVHAGVVDRLAFSCLTGNGIVAKNPARSIC